MDQPLQNPDLSEKDPAASLGRRELLKALAASGGAMAATMLPGQWVEPVVEVGLLPAHAQTSPTPVPGSFTISACSATPSTISATGDVTDVQATVLPIPPVGTVLEAVFTSNDPDVPGPFVYSTAPTNASGVANFAILSLTNATFQPPFTGTQITLTFRFQDQAAFGNDTCTASVTVTPSQAAIVSCGGISSFLQSSTEVLFDDDERIINLFANVSPPPPVGTLIRFDVSVNGAPIAIDDPPPYTIGTDAAGLADFNLATPFPLTVRPILPGIGAGFDELNVGDIVTITFSFEPPVDPTFDPTPCTANFAVIAP